MFPVSLSNLIVAYLFMALALVAVLWLVGERRRRRKEKALLANTVLCRICGEIFEDEAEEELVDCPACGAKNERERIREI